MEPHRSVVEHRLCKRFDIQVRQESSGRDSLDSAHGGSLRARGAAEPRVRARKQVAKADWEPQVEPADSTSAVSLFLFAHVLVPSSSATHEGRRGAGDGGRAPPPSGCNPVPQQRERSACPRVRRAVRRQDEQPLAEAPGAACGGHADDDSGHRDITFTILDSGHDHYVDIVHHAAGSMAHGWPSRASSNRATVVLSVRPAQAGRSVAFFAILAGPHHEVVARSPKPGPEIVVPIMDSQQLGGRVKPERYGDPRHVDRDPRYPRSSAIA
jgi:hypothetical protein